MKHYGVSLFALLLTGFMITSPRGNPTEFNLHAESKVWVEGTSSIHDWTCTVAQVNGSLVAETTPTDLGPISHVNVVIPARSIECKNGTMDKKTYKALKADAHPNIMFAFDTAEVVSGSATDGYTLQVTGRLTVAGVERGIDLSVQAHHLDGDRMRFSGNTPLLMTDFGIAPPKAMLGTLKTGDRVVVHFDVVAAPRGV